MILHQGLSSPSPYSSFYAIIPARSGSKGLPDKNKTSLAGLPLAEHSVAFALSLELFDGVILTTDCDFLLSRAHLYPDVIFHARPSELASDTTSLVNVLLDLYDTSFIPNPGPNPAFALLQPTSPFRSIHEFTNSITYSRLSHPESLVFVSKVSHHPSEFIVPSDGCWNYIIPPPDGSTRRQDYYIQPYFIPGTLYISTLVSLKNHLSFLHSATSFWLSDDPLSIDIDSKFEFTLASTVYNLMLSLGYALDVSRFPRTHLI